MRKQDVVIGEFFAGFSSKGGGIVSKDGVLYRGKDIIAVKHGRKVDVLDSPMAELIIKVASKLRYKVASHIGAISIR